MNCAVPASLEFIYIKLCRFHSFPPPLSHTLAWPIEIYFHIFILWNIADRTDQAGWSDRLVRQAGQTGWSGRLVRQAGQTGWSGRLVRQAGQTGCSDRLVRQAGQAGWSSRLVKQAGQAGWSGRLVRQAGQTGWPFLYNEYQFRSVSMLNCVHQGSVSTIQVSIEKILQRGTGKYRRNCWHLS